MPKAAVDAFIVIAGNLILVKRKKEPFKNKLALPGGLLEQYEEYEKALKREVKEETGLNVEPIKIINAYSSKERDKRDIATVAYLCFIKDNKIKIKDSEETKALTLPLYKIRKIKLAFDHNKIVMDGLNAYIKYLIDNFMDIGRAKQADVLFIKKGNSLQKLIFVFLSSRTKDKITEQACKRLFSTYKSASEIANADIKAIEELIKPVAFYRQKAKRLKELCKIIAKNGIPDNFQELIKLPGIGRKSTAVFLAENQKPFVGVDTHVHRISNRLNLVKTEKEIETEKELQFLNDYNKRNINIAFVAYGQTVCKPINPLCNICPVSKCCYYAYKNKRGFWGKV